MGDVFATILLVALGLLLVSAGIEDARKRTIANWKNAAIAALAPLWWIANGLDVWPDMALLLLSGVVVFALFALAFHFGMMGGGDVKMLGALALWLPLQPLVWLLILMSLIGGALTVIMMIEHRWKNSETPLEIPYGVAIAIAAIVVFYQPNLNHFG
ncbi:A24 family peptidase [Sphingomonas aestuarii]